MSIPGKLEIDRARRRGLDRWATLRDSEMQPHDILVEDLSTTGCRILLSLDLPLDMLVRVGISGAGMRQARIVRGSQPIYGCAFVEPMSDADMRRATRADTVVAAAFSPQLGQTAGGEGNPGIQENPADWSPAYAGAPVDHKRRIPLWVDAIALFLVFLFAIYGWRLMQR